MDVDLLKSINERLAKLDILDILREDINALCLEFSQCQIDDERKANTVLKGPVHSILVERENNQLKENLMSGYQRMTTAESFMSTQLKLPTDVVRNVTFSRVHRMGKASGNGPESIEWQKEMVKSRGGELRNTDLGMNEHFPTEINERRKHPIMKEKRCLNQQVSLVTDTLYINGQLYRDSR
ncbi:unnamed protein product, partial [Coregonus sp. 'balchen']